MGFVDYNSDTPLAHPAAADYKPSYLHSSFGTDSDQPHVKIRDDFYGTRRKLRIAILGAGITAINFLHFAKQKLEDVEIVVYERNEEVGGVVGCTNQRCLSSWLILTKVAYQQVSGMSM